MSTLADMPDDDSGPVHLLLIGDTKLGKSTYAAQAAKDGFTLLYVDADNGKSALMHHLKNDREALGRVHYVATQQPAKFLEKLFVESKTFRWDTTRDDEYNSLLSKDSTLFEVDIQKMLASKNLVLVADSWTSIAADCLGIGADKARVTLTDMGNESQRVYGDAYRRANDLALCMQHAPFHCIVQAHGTIFERYSKPTGKATKDMSQREFILEEVMEVPISTSKPHGKELGKFFNHIAWLTFDSKTSIPITMIDFTRRTDRVGGGPPNRIAKIDEFGFVKLTTPGPIEEGTFRSYPAKELAQPTQLSAGHQGALKPATPPAAPAKPVIQAPAAPAKPLIPAGMLNLNLNKSKE